MPPAAKTAPRRNSPALRKAREELSKYRTRYSAKLTDLRKEKVPNALMNSALAVGGAIPSGVICGVVPDSYMIGETEVPTGVLCEVGCVLTGATVAGVSAAMGSESGIHFGAGWVASGTGFLTKRGTRMARDYAMQWWEARPAAPSLVQNG